MGFFARIFQLVFKIPATDYRWCYKIPAKALHFLLSSSWRKRAFLMGIHAKTRPIASEIPAKVSQNSRKRFWVALHNLLQCHPNSLAGNK